MDAKKALILDAAKKSFALFGYKATTMDHIAKIAAVGKATIYSFFTNKEDLLREIVQGIIAEMRRAADEAIGKGTTSSEKIHEALYAILIFRKEHELLIQLSHEAQLFGNPITAEVLGSIETEVVNYISEHIERGIVAGTMKACDPKLTAFLILKLYVALVFDWEKQNEPLSNERVLELLRVYFGNFLQV